MKPYTKTYLSFFGYDESDFIPCEICKSKAVDIHHIECKGMGGSKLKDNIENLMALCRNCHNAFGDIKAYKVELKIIHKQHIDLRLNTPDKPNLDQLF